MQVPAHTGATASGSGPGAEWNIKSLQSLVWGRRWLIVATAAEVFLLVGLVTFLRTPLYEASARVLIERTTPKVTQGEDIVPAVWNEFEIQRFYQTQYLLLKDPTVLHQALDRENVRERLSAALAPRDERSDATAAPPSDDVLAGAIAARLKIEQVEYSNVVRVLYRDPSPETAAAVVNAVVGAYQEFFVQTSLGARTGAKTFLDAEVQTAQAEVKDRETKLVQLRRESGMVMPSAGSEMGKTRIESLDAGLTESKARRARAEAKLAAYRRSAPTGLDEVRNNPQVVKYQEHLTEMRRELAELEGRVGEGWPRLKELRQAVVETERNLRAEEQRLYEQSIEAARAELDVASRDVTQLDALLKGELHDTADQQRQTVDYQALLMEYEQKKAALDRLLARKQDVALSANLKNILEQQVSIVGRAEPPQRPAVPRVHTNLALGALLGLLLGLAAAFVADILDNKVRGTAQLQELTGLPLLGAIPRVAGKQKPRLVFARGKRREITPVMAAQQHDAEEAFRALRSALLLSTPGHPPRSLLVTSALPGEGKSTIAANLGRTLASFGHRTVLVDADLRHPRLHRAFKLSNASGLTNVLAAVTPLQDALQPTRFPNLSLLPGGPSPPDPALLLDAKHLQRLVQQLSEAHGFEFVIIDTPPVLVFADALNVVPVVEGVVLVARAMQTPKDAVRQALESLRKVQATMLGAVLNGEISEDHSGSYYRYYHYRHGYYQKAQAARASAAAGEGSPVDQADNALAGMGEDPSREERSGAAS